MNNISVSVHRGARASNASAAAAMIFILALVFAPLFAMHAAARWSGQGAENGSKTMLNARAPAPSARVE